MTDLSKESSRLILSLGYMKPAPPLESPGQDGNLRRCGARRCCRCSKLVCVLFLHQSSPSTNFELTVREMKQYSRTFCMFIWMFLVLAINSSESTQTVTKSIKSEDGDIIECVHIYKQPSTDRVLNENYTTFENMQQHKSSMIKKTNGTTSTAVHQVWQKSGNCPSGTIPIRRMTGKSQVQRELEELTTCKSEFAGIETYGNIYGARADINVWSIDAEPNEWSISAINIYNINGSYIQYGWMVSPTLYEDDGETRLFIRTVDPSRGIDCFNLQCNGFVQISNEYAFGAALTPLSQFGGTQYEISLTLYKDETTGRWCAMYGDRLLGYWPPEQFPQFGSGLAAFWGGQLCNRNIGNMYTTTEMGSGRLPSEGWGNSANIHGLEVMDIGQMWHTPQYLHSNLSSDCYKVQTFESRDGKVSAYFGGTGSLQCCGISCE